MKRLAIIASILFNIAYAQSELPPYVDVHIREYIQYYKYSKATNDEAIDAPDSVSYELTDCHYVIDFNQGTCILYVDSAILGYVHIMSIVQDGYRIIVKLEDAADDTEIVIDLHNNVFVYGYGFAANRIVTFPTQFKMTSAKL
jgi:hypothetical protein